MSTLSKSFIKTCKETAKKIDGQRSASVSSKITTEFLGGKPRKAEAIKRQKKNGLI